MRGRGGEEEKAPPLLELGQPLLLRRLSPLLGLLPPGEGLGGPGEVLLQRLRLHRAQLLQLGVQVGRVVPGEERRGKRDEEEDDSLEDKMVEEEEECVEDVEDR